MRRAWSLGYLLASVTVTVIACTTDYQQGLGDVTYGGPNALASQTPPGPSIDEAAPVTGGASSGASTADQPACVKQGGTLLPAAGAAPAEGGAAAACTTSFAKDVLPALLAGGCSAATCHGGTNPSQQPSIDTASVLGSYTSMAKFTPRNGKPYINPCSTDPNLSVVAKNLDPALTESERGTLMPPGAIGLPGAKTVVEAWLKCGSPNN